MRKWGIVISALYAVIVIGLLGPAGLILAGNTDLLKTVFWQDLLSMYEAQMSWLAWVPIAAVVAGQAALLFLSVDTSFRKLKPRTHVAVSVTVTSMLFALLAFAVITSLDAAIRGDNFGNGYLDLDTSASVVRLWIALWLLWGILFGLYFRNSSASITRAISWLLRGSVLELLVAVPCHIVARRRGDCSAPIATSFGIVTGIAVMLLCFGPSVLLLYKKRLDSYAARKSA
jgi:hypothetical protein